ncbi:MAG TPA: aminotransferase class V-fold PLP-dependent enzyme [Solirubrobacteraceae bacterium]|nr:aminotransferase class V-fold PLP-dependent enzyme [Solirubrobacteraceae bacterium]
MTGIADARELFAPQTAYLNTAGYGLPPRPAFAALERVMDQWRHGTTPWLRWQESVDVARGLFASLVGVDAADVAVGTQVASFVGLVALSLPAGARIVAPQEEFTSVLFPFLARSDLRVDLVPLDELVNAVADGADLVALSAVQSADGRIADLDGIAAAAEAVGALTMIDATQACGWLPFAAARFDYTVCATYKWLLAPRGCTFMTVRPEAAERLTPHLAGWFNADPPAASYGGPLRLARTARRFDLSPAWFSWVAQAPALKVLLDVGVPAIQRHDVALANRFRTGLGLDASDSAIVSVAPPDGARGRLDDAGVMYADHGDVLRFSFHLYTTEEHVDRALWSIVGT